LVSSEIPFYNSYLKHGCLSGVTVINNPFLCSANDNFLLVKLAEKLGIETLKTAILPTKERPHGTHSEHFRNMIFPIVWEEIFDYIGFPAVIKPNSGISMNNSFIVYNPEEFHNVYDCSGSRVMIMQESVDFDETFRCFVIGSKVYTVYYDSRKPVHMRFYNGEHGIPLKIRKTIEDVSLKFTQSVGLDFNAVDFVLKGKTPYPIDFINAPPKIDHAHMPPNVFRWLVETLADFLVTKNKNNTNIPCGFFSLPSEAKKERKPRKQKEI
jgi:glutathione synthase/RimK-type ligase-like ATP-grasp enzyme